MAFKPLLLSALASAINQTLHLDPNSGEFLAPLAGKVIAVTITPFNATIYLCPSADDIQLLDVCPTPADTHLTGSLLALGLMGISGKPMRSIFSGAVVIEGDMNTGRKFQALFTKLDIDLESQLARYTGEHFASQLSGLFRAGKNWSAESLETFRLNAAEFLQEETRDLPAIAEMDGFYQQVDELRLAYDRLNSRVERLKTLRNAKQTE
jgi:ubiquinone biosynthesis protein UbiJ